MVKILMMSAKMAAPALLKIKVFWNKDYYVIYSVYDITKSQKVFGPNSFVCRSYRGKTGRGPFCPLPPTSWIGLRHIIAQWVTNWFLIWKFFVSRSWVRILCSGIIPSTILTPFVLRRFSFIVTVYFGYSNGT